MNDHVAQLACTAGAEPRRKELASDLIAFELRGDGSVRLHLASGAVHSVPPRREVSEADRRHVRNGMDAEDVLLTLLCLTPSRTARTGVLMVARARSVCGERMVEFVEVGR